MSIPKTQTGYGVSYGSKELARFDNLPVPEPGPNEVLLKVEAAGLCRSDFHILLAQNPMIPKKMVMGHEICGSIAKIGPGLEEDSRYEVGSRHCLVIVNACGVCHQCRKGNDVSCSESGFVAYGISQDGGFQEYLLVKNLRTLLPIPEGVPYEIAASATDAILTPYHAIMKVRHELGPDKQVLMYGAGGLGLNAIQILKTFGCPVVVLDPKAGNEKYAREFGADEFYTSTDDIMDHPLESFDFIFDFVGNQATVDQSVEFIKSGGKIVMVGLGKLKMMWPNYELARREVQVIFNFGGSSLDQMEILEWLKLGKIKPVVETRPLTDLPEYMKKMQKGEIIGRVVFTPAKL